MSTAATLAGRLRDEIRAGLYEVGAALPPERELAAGWGVSRTTARDALGQLEAEGYVERRVGRRGGTFVARRDATTLGSAVGVVVGAAGIAARDLAEAREVIEPECARRAAERADEADLRALGELQGALSRCGTREEFFALNARFHARLAEASGNAVLAGLIAGLAQPIRELTDDPRLVDADMLAATVLAHEAVLRAVRAGDAARAEHAMRAHMSAHADLVRGDVRR